MDPLKIKKIAVTGATSAIGVSLIRECIDRDIEVLAFSNPASLRKDVIPAHPLVQRVSLSLEEMSSFEPAGLRADAFFHLAWGHTKSTERNDLKTQQENVGTCLDAVRLASKLACQVFLGAGSQAEYGKKQERITEETETEPDTPYGITKLEAKAKSMELCAGLGIRHVWPRIFSAYGPFTGMQTVLMYEISELLGGRVPQMSDGEQLWDFIYLTDVAKALLALAGKGRDREVYNIAYGESRKLKEFLELTRDAVDPKMPLALGAIPKASNTAYYLDADISKITSETGWKPEVPFEKGIRETVTWVRNTV